MNKHIDAAAAPGTGPGALHEIVLQPGSDESTSNYRWYCGVGRELFAEEYDGRWRQIEYVFPDDGGLLVLHWTDGKPSRLWRVAGSAPGGRAEVERLTFPAAEMQVLEQVLHALPHSLWARLIKLALDAHFCEEAFPQRRQQARAERRGLPRQWRQGAWWRD